MKFYKSLGLLAVTAGLLLSGCGDGVTSDKDIVKEAANADALVVNAKGVSFDHKRPNQLSYNTTLNLANSMSASAKIKDKDGNIVNSFVLTKVTWTVSGDGASLWKHNSMFDDTKNDYQNWSATYPKAGEDAVDVAFTATVSYGSASTTVTYNFSMQPKA